MQIKLEKNKIIINNPQNFDIKKTLECGQIFRFTQVDENKFVVYETCNKILVETRENQVIIQTKHPKRHLNYFDFETDYDKINNRIKKLGPLFASAAAFGNGIRILRQDFVETVISFVISANNNIPRIKKALFALCEKFGEKCGDYFAFPSLSSLARLDEEDWKKLGTGYRAKSLVKVCKQLEEIRASDFIGLSTKAAREKLLKLAGVGPKVADCVLLFGLGRKNVFPTDTWIKKVYQQNLCGTLEVPKKISEELSAKFEDDSGLIQQYLFYYKREKGEK